MPGEHSEYIRERFTEDLAALSQKWSTTPLQERLTELIRIYELASAEVFGKESFLAEAEKITNETGILTEMRLWIDTFLTFGRDFLKPDFRAKFAAINTIPEQFGQQKSSDNITNDDLPATRKRGRKPKEQKQPSRKISVKSILKAKKCDHFSEDDAEFVYKNLQAEWGNLSLIERGSALRELQRFTAIKNDNPSASLKTVVGRLAFLSIELAVGYLELVSRPDSLRQYANKDLFDEEALSLIGNMRLKLGDLLDIRELGRELSRALLNKNNLNKQGKIGVELVRDYRDKLQQNIKAINSLQIGETYVIDPNSKLAKQYEGFSDDTFVFVDQNDPALSSLQHLRNSSSDVIFIGRGGKKFVINYKAVCKPSEVKPGMDFDEY